MPGARRAYAEAVGIWRKTLPADHPFLAISLNNLAVAAMDLWDLVEARKLHEEALAIRRKTLPADDPDIAQCLSNLGCVLYDLQDFAAARKAHEEALTIRRKASPPNLLAVAQSLTNLGNVVRELDDLPGARKLHEEAVALARKALPADHPDLAQCLNNLGVDLWEARNPLAARQLHTEALAIRRKVFPQDHPDIAQSLNNLGVALADVHDLSGARKAHEEALGMRRRVFPADHPMIAVSLNNLADVLRDLSQLPGAKRAYDEALTIRRKALPADHPDLAVSLSNLGCILSDLEDFPAARQAYEDALTIWRKVRPAGHPDIAKTLTNLACVLRQLRDLPKARKLHEEALAMRRTALPADHPDLAASLVNLGNVLRDLGDLPGARHAHVEAVAILRKVLPPSHPDIAVSVNNLANVLYEQGKTAEAEPLLREAVQIDRRAADDLALAQDENEQLALAALYRWHLDNLLRVAAECKHLDAVYAEVLALKGSVTSRQRWMRLRRDSHDPETGRLLDELGQVNRQLLTLGVQPPNTIHRPASPAQLRDTTAQLLAERGRLERLLSERSSAFRAGSPTVVVTPDEVRQALPAGAALVEYLEYGDERPAKPPQLIVFVLRPDQGAIIALELGAATEVNKSVERWRSSYGIGRWPAPTEPDPATILRQRVWAPVEKYLDGVHLVLIAPEGSLTGLPFAALPGRDKQRWLIERYAFASIPIPQQLPEMVAWPRPQGTVPPSLLLMGGMDYNAAVASADGPGAGPPLADGTFRPLTGTATEVNDVQKLFAGAFGNNAGVEHLTSAAATKEKFVRAAGSFRWLHLATHGYFAGDSVASALDTTTRQRGVWRATAPLDGPTQGLPPGLLSGVAFAGANHAARAGGTGILTALEASELDLRDVELVVLSACETGRGRLAGGEGVLGLQRAFLVAGARSVAASLWKVPDNETQRLMVQFYRELWQAKDVSKAEALRKAQLYLLQHGPTRGPTRGPLEFTDPPDPRGVSPYYWAAFVLAGDWR